MPEKHKKCLQVSSSVKGKSLSTPPSGRECAPLQMANVGDRMNLGISILSLPSTYSLLGGCVSGQSSGQFIVHRMRNNP